MDERGVKISQTVPEHRPVGLPQDGRLDLDPEIRTNKPVERGMMQLAQGREGERVGDDRVAQASLAVLGSRTPP
jgi:hypothetical protein